MFDPISDMLTRIRNAQMAGHKQVTVPFSKLKMVIAEILEKENFVEMARKEKTGKFDEIKIDLKYNKVSNMQKDPAISGINRVSKVGQRIYVKKGEIRKVKNNYGISIISTSKGLMTGRDARKIGLGGELICEIW
jgi:small subunit ribosomal protein S8